MRTTFAVAVPLAALAVLVTRQEVKVVEPATEEILQPHWIPTRSALAHGSRARPSQFADPSAPFLGLPPSDSLERTQASTLQQLTWLPTPAQRLPCRWGAV
jgi:hypothetical protein